MNDFWWISLCMLFGVALTGCGGSTAGRRQILWQIDKTNEFAGHKVKVLGNPEVIEVPGGSAVAFDGRDDGLIVDANPLSAARSFTVEVIFRPDPSATKAQRFVHMQATQGKPGARGNAAERKKRVVP